MNRTALGSSLAALAASLASPSAAQETGQDQVANQVEDIVVTAQRRSERLQDVPVSITALSGDTLADTQVRTLQDLAATVPGLTVTNSANYGSAPLSIRGVGGANGGGNVFADEPVAIYIDDVFIGRPRVATSELVDLAAVEVLRGPQGVLFGRNATAGAVLLRSATPGNTGEAFFTAGYDSLEILRVQGVLSGPIGDSGLQARVAAGVSDRDGWIDNLAGGPDLERGRDTQLRGILRYVPTSDLTIDLIGEYSYSLSYPGLIAVSDVGNLRDAGTNPSGSNVVTPYVRRPALNRLIDENEFSLATPTFTRVRGSSGVLRVNWDTGPVTVTSVTAYRRWRMRGQQDSVGIGNVPPLGPFVTGTPSLGSNFGFFRDSQFSQELRLASPAEGRFTWLLGGFYYREKNALDPFTIRNGLAGPGTAGTDATFVDRQVAENWAVFANAGLEIVDGLRLSVGGRYSEETKDFRGKLTVRTVNRFDPPGPAVFPAGTVLANPPQAQGRLKFTDFSPRVVLDWRASEDMLLYASYSEGYKSGGFNAFAPGTTFRPERNEAFEVGMKNEFFDRRLRLNVSAFHYDYSDLQVRTAVATGGVNIENADARVRGFEVEGAAVLAEGLRLTASYAYLDAEFRGDSTLTTIVQPSWVFGTNPAVGTERVAGNRLSRAPEGQFAATIDYSFPIGSLDGNVQAGVRSQTSVFFLETQQAQPTYRVGGFTLLDARLALAGEKDRWEVALFGRNLTDERYISQIASFFGLPVASVNEARRIGLQFTARY